ncbi:MAG: hypothetical protein WCD47_19470 [Candidatus Sulfotelmatobacter sp.]
MKNVVVVLAAMSVFSVLLFARSADSVAIRGFVTDTSCAARGKKTCSDRTHLTKDNPMVLVSDSDATIYTLVRPGKLVEHEGQHVEVRGVVNREQKTIEVQNFSTLN